MQTNMSELGMNWGCQSPIWAQIRRKFDRTLSVGLVQFAVILNLVFIDFFCFWQLQPLQEDRCKINHLQVTNAFWQIAYWLHVNVNSYIFSTLKPMTIIHFPKWSMSQLHLGKCIIVIHFPKSLVQLLLLWLQKLYFGSTCVLSKSASCHAQKFSTFLSLFVSSISLKYTRASAFQL